MPSTPAERPKPASSVTIENFIVRYTFAEDGSGTREYRMRVHLADQAAVDAWGLLVAQYMADSERVELRELEVLKPDGSRIDARSASMEDVAASNAREPIFSDLRLKRVAVPALQVGDRLQYQIAIHRSLSLIPGHFWVDHSFVRDAAVLNEVLEIETAANRTLQVVFRRGTEAPVETVTGGRRVRRWTHRQSEPDPALTNPERRMRAIAQELKLGPDVRASSFSSWDQLAHWFQRTYDQRTAPTDAVRQRALELTKGVTSKAEQLRILYDFVGTHIRYVSLALGAGRLEPRAPQEVLAAEYGDCKDKHTLLASLARALDINVRPALVSHVSELDHRVPSPTQFDHVVSVAKAGSDDMLWMDSTAGVLPMGALSSGVRGKRSLLVGAVADQREPVIVTTPELLPVPNRVSIDIVGALAPTGEFTARVTRTLEGDSEFESRQFIRSLSESNYTKLGEYRAQADGLLDDDQSVESQVKDVVVRDHGPGRGLELAYSVARKFSLEREKPWRFWPLAPEFEIPTAPDQAEGIPVELGFPTEYVLTIRYDMPSDLPGPALVPVTLDREFATYRSTYGIDRRTLTIARNLRTRARTVQPERFPELKAFRRAVDADYRQQVAVHAVVAPSESPVTADALNNQGVAALERRAYKEAIALLTRATEADPKHRWAWNNLGRAHLEDGNAQAAVEALDRQIAVDPLNEHAYTNLGRALWRLKQHDRALEQFKKQLEITPLDKFAHSNLAGLYLELKQFVEAAAAAERAVSLAPDDTFAWFALASARLEMNQADTALAAYKEGLRLAPGAEAWNNVAYTLAEKGVHLDEAERWANQAVDSIATTLNDASLDGADIATFGSVVALAAYWDTLGWIHFKQGNDAAAERYLRASWTLSQHAVVGNHLAQVYERLGRREDAIARYAEAASVGGHEESRRALDRLVGKKQAQQRVALATTALVASRTVAVAAKAADGIGEVNLQVDGTGRIIGARFVSGASSLRETVDSLTGTQVHGEVPAGQAVRVVRRAALSCVAARCSLVLMRPVDVIAASLQTPR